MQLVALDGSGKIIFIEDAQRQQDYFCMECQGKVRVKGGTYRRNHFFHAVGSSCRQSQKSIEHIQVQCFLKENLQGQVNLEHRFPTINRIADVVWEDERIIFEVQCSPITAKEVEERNRDYAKCNYQVIWILHEKTFNNQRLTATEHFLRRHPHYFTNMKATGHGIIYDQYITAEKGKRQQKSPQYPVELLLERSKPQKSLNPRTQWPCKLQSGLKLSEIPQKSPRKRKGPFALIKQFYKNIFQIMLENATR